MVIACFYFRLLIFIRMDAMSIRGRAPLARGRDWKGAQEGDGEGEEGRRPEGKGKGTGWGRWGWGEFEEEAKEGEDMWK
jgi:hypothetical protein